MAGQILDGKILAQRIKDALKDEIVLLKNKTGNVPTVVNLLIGDDQASLTYANSQKKVAESIGINYKLITMDASTSQEEFLDFIESLNQDPYVNGVMIHNPVPGTVDYQVLANRIHSIKDIEGMNLANLGKMVFGKTKIIPCTAAAVMEHINFAAVNLNGKEAVIVGRSEIVGKPLILLLLEKNATVTICHSGTSKAGRLVEHISHADIVIACAGNPELIKGEWIKKGAVVIDVGINHVGPKIFGDVEYEAAKERAAFITPVPGGVGPVTVVMLMRNAVEAFKIQTQDKVDVKI